MGYNSLKKLFTTFKIRWNVYFSTSDRTTFLLLDYVTKVRRNTLLLRSLNYPNTRAFVSIIIPTRLALGPFGLHWSTLPFISYSFEYTLRSTRRLNGPTKAQNAQYNLVWAYRSRRMRWHICWPYWFIANVKKYHLTKAQRHLLEFSTFSRLPYARFSYIEVLKHVGHWPGL